MITSADSLDPMSGLWSLLAVTLRMLRKKHNLSQTDLGLLVSADHKTVSNWEAGRNHPPVDALRILDADWHTNTLLASLHHYANTLQSPAQFLAYVEYEALALVVKVYGCAYIPGLLQTPEYAREAFRLAGSKDVEGQVAKRMARQSILSQESPPFLSVLLSEISLAVLPEDIRDGQLKRLLEMADMPNISIRLVPMSAGLHIGLHGEFHLFTTPAREVGFIETAIDGTLVTEVADLKQLHVKWEQVSGRALSAEATRAKLREMSEVFRD